MSEHPSECMDDRERCEQRLITRHGRPVGDPRLYPPEGDEE